MKRLIAFVLLTTSFLSAPASAEVIQEGDGYLFKLDASTWTDRPRQVSVAGDFNGWNAGTTPLTDPDEDNVWTATVTGIEPGTRYYKFVINGDRWIADPTGDRELEGDDNYGAKNSGFVAGPDIRKAPPAEPDAINTKFIRFDPVTDLTVVDQGTVAVSVEAQAGDVTSVVAVADDKTFPLSRASTRGGYDTFEGTVDAGTDTFPLYFRLEDGSATAVLNADGAFTASAGNDVKGLGASFEVAVPHFDIPEWATRAQWYQIFPERFRNGEPSNDPGAFTSYERLVPWNGDWWSPQPGEATGENNFYNGAGVVWQRRYGGDLQGVREKLPYLRDLGVNAIYFNPIFEAESMHKYDTADFRHVDNNFGVIPDESAGGDIAEDHSVYPYVVEGETVDPSTWKWSESDRLFLEFIEEAHAMGFKVVVDGVFNHVGTAHPFFQDVLKKGKESEFADWFEVTDWGDSANWGKPETVGQPGGIQYNAWDKKNGALPVFRKNQELGLAHGPREHIMAITARWTNPDGDPATNDGVDGWRLDVPGDIPHPFWKDWRKVVKENNPEAYITGEIWTQAQPWLRGDEFDAVMNYQFAMAAQDFFVDEKTSLTASAFAERLEDLTELYARPVTMALQNLFDSHDTDRLASMFVNPDRPYDGANRLQDSALTFDGPLYSGREPDEEEWARFLQAVRFQQAFVGAPMTYYGNEAGMWSPDDPSNRMPFPWPDNGPYTGGVGFKEPIFGAFRHAIAARNTLEALQTGDYETVLVDDERQLIGFRRTTDDESVYVVINRSSEPRRAALAVKPGTYDDYLDATSTRLVEPTDPSTRATIEPTGAGIETDEELLELTLDPWDVAIVKRR